MTELPHFDPDGNPHIVDVGAKPISQRMARASCRVSMLPETMKRIRSGDVKKGGVAALARVAGIMATKRTADLIPLCHPLLIDAVAMDIEYADDRTMVITSEVTVTGKTGVEMEALHAVMTAALTVYDMCKSADRSMQIGPAQLEEKRGGKSGHYQRSAKELK